MLPPPPWELALAAADAAGEVLLAHAQRRRDGSELAVATKSTPTDPVTEADRAAERRIAEVLLDARPDDGVVGEEGEVERSGTSGYRWVVDPLDGTVNYLYGQPQWCVSIACEDLEGVRLGVVHAPALGETWLAERHRGTRVLHGPPAGDGRERFVKVTDPSQLQVALVATGFGYDPELRRGWADHVADLLGHVRDVRRGGSAALDLAWTAAGRLDGYVEGGLNPWDWAAGSLLVTESGGRVSRRRVELGGQQHTVLTAGGVDTHDRLRGWLDGRFGAPGPGEELT